MPSRQGRPNYLPSKQVRQDLLKRLRSQAEQGDSLAITGVLLLDHLIRADQKLERAEQR